MKLFLASTIKNENTIKALQNFIPDTATKKLVYIPTAANSEEGFGFWKRAGKTTYNITKSLNPNLKILELEFVTDEEAQEVIKSAEILFVAGGFPGYLSYWLYRRKLIDLIKQQLKDGMIYVGISAGAMVCSKSVKLSSFFEGDPFAEIVPGMGIIDYEIWPHYKDDDENKLKEKYPDLKIKLLRDGEQVTIAN